MLIIGHRGCAYEKGENTIAGISAAINAGVDGIEVDLRLLDGRVILLHDGTVTRTTNGRGGYKNYSYDSLRQLICKNGQPIPTLEEVMPLLLKVENIYLEIKESDVFGALWPILRKKPKQKQKRKIFLSSFNESILESLKDYRAINKALVVKRKKSNLVQRCLLLDCLQLHVSFEVVDEQLINESHHNNIKVLVYTINELHNLKRCFNLGVDGIFTDFPFEMIKSFNQLSCDRSK